MIDWRAITELVTQRLALAPAEARVTALAGGSINRAFRLDLGAHRFFIKLNRAALLPMFDAERLGLEEIARSNSIRVPEVLLSATQGDHAFILMEYIELGATPTADGFAGQLAAMHLFQYRQFGFHRDNFIGSTPQPNRFSDDWAGFWQQQRLGYQLALAAERGLDAALVDAGQRLNQELGRFFQAYRPLPSLLHGDLWRGNWSADSQGNPLIYDPACYYGDHEAELAMMELFGHPGDRFFAVYREIFAIDAGYPQRRELYNLYHLLNHANLFGGAYPDQARKSIEKLLAQL